MLLYRDIRPTVALIVVHLDQNVCVVTCLNGPQESPHHHSFRLYGSSIEQLDLQLTNLREWIQESTLEKA